MTSLLFQLSDKLDPGTVALYVTVKGKPEVLRIPYVAVDASVRDLKLLALIVVCIYIYR